MLIEKASGVSELFITLSDYTVLSIVGLVFFNISLI